MLLELAAARLFRAKWTEHIHEEWMRSLLRDRPDLTRQQLERTASLMTDAVPDCLVTGYEALIPALRLPDEDDRHVLAAAIVSSADVIVTKNLKDFPERELGKYGVAAEHPDDFIFHLFGLDHAAVVIAAQRCRARLRRPAVSPADFLARLEAQQLSKTAAELRRYDSVL